MRKILLALSLVIALVPAAQANHTPACDAVTRSSAIGAASAYVYRTDDDVQVWEETNGLDGLQTRSCTSAGDHVPADTLHTSQPADAVEAVEDVLDMVPNPIAFIIETCNQLVGPGTSCL